MQRLPCMVCNSIVSVVRGLLLLALMGGFGAGAWAAGAAPAGPPPNCDAKEFHAFDFWIGTWEVFLPDGRRAGENHITATRDGCVLVERWTNVGGGGGYSMNFFDPGQGLWRQIWVSPGSTIEISGGLEDGAMVLEGEIRVRTTGDVQPFRGRWSLEPDGRVRQFFEQRDEDGWQPWFEGFYTKVVE